MVDPRSRTVDTMVAQTTAAQMDDLPTIVVVDDTPEILDLLSLVLADEGFQVVCCSEANGALDVVVAERPALVIVDLTMEGVPTWGLVDAMVADPRTRHIP